MRYYDSLDVSDDCIWLGSYVVARLNPNLHASLRSKVETLLNPLPEPLDEYEYLEQVFNDIQKKLEPLAKANLVTMKDVRRILQDMKDAFGLE